LLPESTTDGTIRLLDHELPEVRQEYRVCDVRKQQDLPGEGAMMATKVFRGSSDWGVPILTIESGRVFEGPSSNSVQIMCADGNSLYMGTGSWGIPIACIQNDQVFKGSSTWGVPVASLAGRLLFKGSSAMGIPIATLDGPDIKPAAMAAAAYLLF